MWGSSVRRPERPTTKRERRREGQSGCNALSVVARPSLEGRQPLPPLVLLRKRLLQRLPVRVVSPEPAPAPPASSEYLLELSHAKRAIPCRRSPSGNPAHVT